MTYFSIHLNFHLHFSNLLTRANNQGLYFLFSTFDGLSLRTLMSLFDERSILSNQGSIFLENELSEQAELSKQGGIFIEQFRPNTLTFEK